MKTKFYLPTLLAFIIQVMVNGQTQDNQTTQIRKPLSNVENTSINVNYGIQLSEANISDLINTINELRNISQAFENAASIKYGDEKRELLVEARFYEKLSIRKQIELSAVTAKQTYKKLYQNRNYINTLLKELVYNEYAILLALNLNSQAEKHIKMAKEMREEAFAQANDYSILANISNAEDEEYAALDKQQEVLDVIDKLNPKVSVR